MIGFQCPQCHREFRVAAELAGRTGRCKSCGESLTIPLLPPSSSAAEKIVISFDVPSPLSRSVPKSTQPSSIPNPPQIPAAAPVVPAGAASGKMPLRHPRLLADAAQMTKAFERFPFIQVEQMAGAPPELYRVQYNVRGLARGAGGNPVYRDQHVVEIQLTREYPRHSPKCKMLTPVFHPNIEPATICVADHWTAGERLVDLVVRIGEMLAFQAYNIQSPLDGEAAMWADLNRHSLPTDPRDLHPPGLE